MSIPSVKITSFKSTLTQERTYSTNGDSNFPYIRITEEFSTNLFLTFREGGTTKSGERVANEAVFETPDYPVIGIALFASRYQQARLLSLLNNRIVEDGEYAGGPAYVISGYVEKPVNMKITQIYSKADYLLLEQSISSDKAPLNVSKIMAVRSSRQDAVWPYESIMYESWSQVGLVSKVDLNISATRRNSGSDSDFKRVILPQGTLVSDKRFGFSVSYFWGIDHLADSEIAKMATDPDYRTNRYYLKYRHLTAINQKSTFLPNSIRRAIIICALASTALLPVLLILWRKKNASKI